MTTLERMARAMFAADSYDNAGRVWEHEGQQHAAYRAMARAAIEAIKVPDDESAWAIATAMGTRNRLRAGQDFTAICDAILKGEA